MYNCAKLRLEDECELCRVNWLLQDHQNNSYEDLVRIDRATQPVNCRWLSFVITKEDKPCECHHSF